MILFDKLDNKLLELDFHCIGLKITRDFAFELNFLTFIRRFSDGVDWFHLEIKSDWYKGDHNPQFGIHLIILNITIFEFRIYNVNHVEDDLIKKEMNIECPKCKNPLNIRIE
jgi:hypothetical protein